MTTTTNDRVESGTAEAGPREAGDEPAPSPAAVGARVTRRHVQLGLGVLWLLDGVLQLQPYMFTRKFATRVIAPAAAGQPVWVSWPVRHAAVVIAAHPAPWDALFAVVQLALGVGFLWRRTARAAVACSVVWALGIWFLGESLGGLAGGTASPLTGGPGAAVLYAVLALAARPTAAHTELGRSPREAVASWFPLAWAAIWLDAAVLVLLPVNRSVSAVRSQLEANVGQVPGWLGRIDRWATSGVGHIGGASVVLLVVVPAAIGVAGLGSPRQRRAAAWAGAAAALGVWVVGEAFGQLASGSATDPNTGPLLALCSLALLGVTGPRRAATRAAASPWRPRSAGPTTADVADRADTAAA